MRKIILAALTITSIAACSPEKVLDPKEVKLQPQAPEIELQDNEAQSQELRRQSLDKVEDIYTLYSPAGTLTAPQILSLLSRFAPSLSSFAEAILKAHPAESYTFDTFSKLLAQHCLSLQWLEKGPVHDRDSLQSTLSLFYPNTQAPLIRALAEAMTLGWTDDTPVESKTESLFKRGATLARLQIESQALLENKHLIKLINKNLWALLPHVASEDLQPNDRTVSLLLLGLRVLDRPQTPVSTQAAGEDRVRTLHRKYFAALGKALSDLWPSGTITVPQIEALDWDLNNEILGHIQAGLSIESQGSRFLVVFPGLASLWDKTKAFFEAENKGEYRQDLLTASAADDVISECQLKQRSLNKEFLQVFLFRVSAEVSSETANRDEFCKIAESAFNMPFTTYHMWRLRLLFATNGSSPEKKED